MNWYKESQVQTYLGYKVVGFNPKTNKFYSIYDKSIYDISIGKEFYNPKGIYLGSSKQFCINYYICGTEDDHDEYILELSYSSDDLLKGEPEHSNGEILVTKAKIINMEKINKKEYC